MKTKKQLSELGLSPKNPVGFISTSKYNLHLYDPDNPESARPKRQVFQKRLEVLKKGQRKAQYQKWYRDGGFMEFDRLDAIKWAESIIAEGNFCILDTETTSLEGEVVEIAIIDSKGNPEIDTLIKPREAISPEAQAVHGITHEMVATAPRLDDIWEEVSRVISSHNNLIVYNSSFDLRRIKQSLKVKTGLRKLEAHCLITWYAQFCGEWSVKYDDYKLQPLNGGHRALGDCLAALDILKEMAEADKDFWCPVPEYLPKLEDENGEI
ncbi:3'-5' exonuclease [Laspinema palackyanum]|uniref:3'-5' exonuclease n=1 Tax=Laspinema palackyanum TaxID=3231601 RepID=UPI00345DEC2B|nr:3'-5' exonuclease [Laspinema sp. D2c]